MAVPRRFLPPMSLLCAFEAAARLESFTAAAQELSLTQSAVSRQIRAHEQILGSELFHREKQTVRLTLAGEAYARDIRDVLKRVAAATLGFRGNPHGGSLNLAVLPAFGVRWLSPRLPQFLAEHPEVTINLTTRLAPFDFNSEPVDAAIHFGSADWLGAELIILTEETVSPYCSAELKRRFNFQSPEDLLKAPLLHLVSRPDAWERWFETKGVSIDEIHGMLTDQFLFAAQAASAGLGVALLPGSLFKRELQNGELVEAVCGTIRSPGNYYLAWPPNRDSYPPLTVFKEWITREARRSGLVAGP